MKNLGFLWSLLSQCGIRKSSDILSRLAHGISLSLGKQKGELAEYSPPAQFAHRLYLFQTSGLWDVHLDAGQGQFGKKGTQKNPTKNQTKPTTDVIQNYDSRENLLHGKKSTTLDIWCTRYTLRQTSTTSSGLSFEYPRNSRYLSWLSKLDLGLPQITTRTPQELWCFHQAAATQWLLQQTVAIFHHATPKPALFWTKVYEQHR